LKRLISKPRKKTKKLLRPLKEQGTSLKVGGVNQELLKSFTDFMREEGLASFYFKTKEFELELSFGNGSPLTFSPATPANLQKSLHKETSNSGSQSIVNTVSAKPVAAPSQNMSVIKSPFVGTFYRAAGPGKANFVEVGSVVKEGDALCILEAMKLMNEIEAEFKCRILRILVEDATPIEYGESLFEVEIL